MGDVVLGQEEVRALVAGELDVDPAAIGPDEDLVTLGLHSMRMIRIAASLRRRGVRVNFSDLALRPTVLAWSELIEERLGAEGDRPARPVEPPRQESAAGEPFGLATMQHGYWIGRADGQALGGVAAHLYAEFDGQGVEPRRLERAVVDLVNRHGMLRSQFLDDGTQRVLDQPGHPIWSLTDLREVPAAEVEGRLEEIRRQKTHQRMRADLGQVLDVSLTLLAGGRTRLHVDVDMLAADALSYRLMLADLAAFYRDGGSALAPLSYDYRSYLADYNALNAAAREEQRAWWQEVLPELPDAPALPLVPESEREDPLRTVRYEHWLDPEHKRRLIDRAHERGVTPATVLASVFADVVGTWSSEQKFLLNLPLFNREPLHPDVERLVGDFSSSVLLDVDVTEPLSVLERARRFQRNLHTKASHVACPGLDVLRDLGRLRGEPVLANVVYTSGLNLGELFQDTVIDTFGEPVWIISQGPQVVLDAQVVELRGGLLFNWDVREQAFPAGMMDTMFRRNRELLEELLADDADWGLVASRGLPPAQAAVRASANDTDRPVSGRLLHEGFFEHARSTPELPAVVGGADGELTYGRLRDRALRVAGALVARGVRPGDAVSIQLPKGPDQVVAALGVLAAGASYVPIGVEQPDVRRDSIERTGDVVLALRSSGGSPEAGGVPVLDLGTALDGSEPLEEPVAVDPESVAYVIFTSGSTGLPKGVEVAHAAAMNTVDCVNEYFGISTGDRSLGVSPFEFDLSVYDIFGLLSVGGCVVLPDDESRRDGQRAAELVRAHGVTVLNCVPSLLDAILAGGEAQGLGTSLRVVILGGDWVGVDLPERLRRLAPGCRFAGLGGTTEAAIHSTVCEVTGDVPAHWKAVPYGVPLGNVRCRVVNEAGADCPDLVPGELWIGGRGVARGYRNDPERTEDRFVLHEGRRWYRTGDLARYWPDGTLEFLGRRDSQIKVRGYRIELGEVEAALRALPAVHRAVADVVGETTRKLVATVTLTEAPDAPEASGTASDAVVDAVEASDAVEAGLREALAAVLPPHMIPERIEILDAFPLTPNGKLDRKAVRTMLDAGAAGERPHTEPSGDLETVLADIVGSVLGAGRVSVEGDFFALGGDSVLATKVIAQIRQWLDTSEPTVTDLFAARTVRELAVRLAKRQSAPGRIELAAGIYREVAAMSLAQLAES
ncbi:amino acid adenylation domain-containing protein [Streptomyces anulatus]|uniref:Phenyloxazoline synthase MbtB n=3 Tax=Streptomyces TaxID=1883 RepID=A0A6G3SST4_STRAQ|nr:amino acid adenylation domain-containing protein [Streptomyces anulatus]